MVVYYGMSERLPNLSYYDSTGQAYGFSKPYSDDRARMIDEEVSRIISEQYERAKAILREHAKGHNELAEVLYSREVIFTEDVEHIFGKRKWASRTDEILAAQQLAEKQAAEAKAKSASGDGVVDVEAKEVTVTTPPASMPPIPSLKPAQPAPADDASASDDSADKAGKEPADASEGDKKV